MNVAPANGITPEGATYRDRQVPSAWGRDVVLPMALTIGSICLHSGQLCEVMVCAQHDIHMEYHKVYRCRCIHSIGSEHGLVIIGTAPFHPPTAVRNKQWTVSVSCRRLMAGAMYVYSPTYWFDHRLLEGLWFDLLGYSITQTGGE